MVVVKDGIACLQVRLYILCSIPSVFTHTREVLTNTCVSNVATTLLSLHDFDLSRRAVLQVDLGDSRLKQGPGSYIRSPGHEVGHLLPYTYSVSWISFKCPGSYIRSLGDRASSR